MAADGTLSLGGPIPLGGFNSALIAIAAGDLAERPIGPRYGGVAAGDDLQCGLTVEEETESVSSPSWSP